MHERSYGDATTIIVDFMLLLSPALSDNVRLSHEQVKVIEGEQHYRMSGKSGVGLFFLEEDSLFIVRNIVEGGSAWRDGTIKLSDICVAVDGTTMEDSRRQLSGEGATVWTKENGFLTS